MNISSKTKLSSKKSSGKDIGGTDLDKKTLAKVVKLISELRIPWGWTKNASFVESKIPENKWYSCHVCGFTKGDKRVHRCETYNEAISQVIRKLQKTYDPKKASYYHQNLSRGKSLSRAW